MQETTEKRKPYELPPLTGIEQYPVFIKSLALCVEIRLRVRKFDKSCKYDLGKDINEASTKMLVLVIDGLGLPISRAKEKSICFEDAFRLLKVVNALLMVANGMNCISDRDKALIDEHLRDVAGQIRKISNGLIRKMNISTSGLAPDNGNQENV